MKESLRLQQLQLLSGARLPRAPQFSQLACYSFEHTHELQFRREIFVHLIEATSQVAELGAFSPSSPQRTRAEFVVFLLRVVHCSEEYEGVVDEVRKSCGDEDDEHLSVCHATGPVGLRFVAGKLVESNADHE